MKRRFQIAKALVHDPDIIILDEPTAGVDVELRRNLWQYLRDLHAQGKTILLTTHYIEEAELLCENVAIIDEGKILIKGSPKDLTQELGSAGITVQLGNVGNSMESFLDGFTFTREENRLHFSVKNPDSAMPKIIQQLSKADVHIQSIESKVSSLEDVFLNLTGKGINE
jgi:ABC-2 type transport system ATP-binding protein